jgi:hypothetical protein
MKLIDMKLPKKTKKELKEENVISYEGDGDRYPYGLRIHFETKQLENLPYLSGRNVGDKCMVYAEATITDNRMFERQSGKKEHTVGIQIEKIDIQPKLKSYSKKMSPKEYKEFRKQDGGK